MSELRSLRRQAGETLAALAVGAAGAGVFHLIGFPAAFLTGPALAVTLAILAGARLDLPLWLRNAALMSIGLGIGATVTPEVLHTAVTWPASLVVLALTLVASTAVSNAALRRLFGFERLTALLACTPGHLSFVAGLSADLGADVSRIVIVQTMRVLFLTLLVPVLLTLWGFQGDTVLPQAGPIAPVTLAVLLLLSVIAAQIFQRLRVPAPWLIGAMFVSAIGHGSDLSPGQLPPAVTIAAFVVMGVLIGTRFRGQSLAELKRNFVAGVVVTAIVSAVAALGAVVVAELLGLSPAMLLISFAPGGVEVMAAMAVQIGVEPAFVAAHHVFRLMILSVLIPTMVVRVRRRAPGPEAAE